MFLIQFIEANDIIFSKLKLNFEISPPSFSSYFATYMYYYYYMYVLFYHVFFSFAGNKFPETVEPIYFDSSEDVPYITSRPDTGLQQAGQNGAPGYTHTSRDVVLWTTLFSLITLMALRLNG